MADRFSKQNEAKELEELRQVLVDASAGVSLPDNLKGENLLHLLDDVEQDSLQEEKKEKRKIYFLSWQAIVTYAALFAILVASFRGLSQTTDQFVASPSQAVEVKLLEDQEATYPDGWEEGTLVHQSPTGPAGNPENMAEEAPTTGGTEGMSPDSADSRPKVAAQSQDGEEPPAMETSDTVTPETYGVGGGSPTTSLGEWNGFDITWRSNDPTDLDKGGSPTTIELVDLESNEVHQQVNLTHMQRIDSLQVGENALIFVGATEQGDLIQVYSAGNNQEISLLAEIEYPSGLYLHQIQGDTLYTAAGSGGLSDGWESTVLWDSSETGSAYLAVINLSTGSIDRLALQGVTEYVTVENNTFVVIYRDSDEVKQVTQVQYSDNTLELLENNK